MTKRTHGPEKLRNKPEKVLVPIEGQRETFRDPASGALILLQGDRRAEKALIREEQKAQRAAKVAEDLLIKDETSKMKSDINKISQELSAMKAIFAEFISEYKKNNKGKP